ncbi:MAG: Mur ligase family protein [Bacteroidales bacterium]|nr:Mur ligase family protein [Bacteroidales bacterium]
MTMITFATSYMNLHSMNYHFIAIGGAVMHNLAIALHQKGHTISGSDDEIFDPAKSRLQVLGLLPEMVGWFPDKIHPGLDAVLVGMHARKENPELSRAIELGIKIFSFPEFLYEHARNKKRVVVGGSHGKTTITAMIMHVLRHCGKDFDYLVGAQLEGFDVMVKISDTAPIMVYEGDEYLAAPFDPRPKFHLYHPHIALISGIAWDHINVFPDFDEYVEQFRLFVGMIEPGGSFVYNQEDSLVTGIAMQARKDIVLIPYTTPEYGAVEGVNSLSIDGTQVPLQIFGRHNMQNLAGAMQVCIELGVAKNQFLDAIKTFSGAARRLELLSSTTGTLVFKDFAHSPSKLKASVNAVKEQYPESNLVACMELHTFSSLSKDFLQLYSDCMEKADVAIVYFNPHAIALKKLSPINASDVQKAFRKKGLMVYSDSQQLIADLLNRSWKNTNLLMMSSGDFDGTDLTVLAAKITG